MNPADELRLAIAARMDQIVQEEFEAAKVRAQVRMKESIPALSLEFASWYTMQDYTTHLEIRVCKPEAK